MQASRPIYFSNCALYCVKAFQKKRVGWTNSYVSVGVKLPDGTYDRPAQVKHFYWFLPGEYASGSITVFRMSKKKHSKQEILEKKMKSTTSCRVQLT